MYQLSRQIPVMGEYDILVAGAGPAGLCAAMAAARAGARVALVERHGTVGGNLTLGHVGPIMGKLNPDTMAGEINDLLNGGTGMVHDTEDAKRRLMNWIDHDLIDLYLLCPVVDAIMEAGQIKGLDAEIHTEKMLHGTVFPDHFMSFHQKIIHQIQH